MTENLSVVSIRICLAALALSSIEIAALDPNSIDLIIDDKCHDLRLTYGLHSSGQGLQLHMNQINGL